MAAPCRTKVAEQLLEIGAKAGIVGLAGVAIKDVADKMTSDELDHLVTLEMMGNDEITGNYLSSLQDKYAPSHTGNNDGQVNAGPNHTGNNAGQVDAGPNHTGNNGSQINIGPNNTGGDQSVEQLPSHTGNTDSAPELPNHMTSDDNGAEKPSNIKMADDKYLKNNGVDAHALKADFLGDGKNSNYDIYVDRNSGQLWIFKKGGKGEGIPTGEYIK
ncbi:polymorphic toxin type 33 domain-containing protein [Yersinia enterocolitica]